MKSLFRTLALLLVFSLLAVPASAVMVIQVGDSSISIKDEIAQDPAFQKGLEALMQEIPPFEENADRFLAALDELTLTVVNHQMGVEYEDVKAHEADARYEFDRKTGTILQVTVLSGVTLVLPETIDGVAVTAIAPGAIDGADVESIVFLNNFTALEGVMIRNCPKLKVINTAPTTRVTGKIYENCPMMGQEDWNGEYFEYELRGSVNLPQKLLTRAKVFRGDSQGNQNWSGRLTRAEAVTLILRLTGKEAEAQAAQGEASPFSDVPDWAKGYVNVAYETGMAKGVGGDRFDPSGLCGAQEFSLMLLRLTDYTEGTDYAWATAIRDVQKLVGQARAFTNQTDLDGALFSQLHNSGKFTREYACALMYRMLSAPTGGGGAESLGDVLFRDGAMSGTLLVGYGVRLTTRALGEETLSLFLSNPKTPDTVTLAGNRVSVDGSAGLTLSLAPMEGGAFEPVPGGNTATLTGPARLAITLPLPGGATTFSSVEVKRDPQGDLYLSLSPSYLNTCIIDRDIAAKEAALAKTQDDTYSADIQSLADRLTAGLNDDYAKAKAISAWVAENITYDYNTLNALEANRQDTLTGQPTGGLTAAAQDADTVLATKTGVCAGYANLTAALMGAADVPCITVTSGIANHAWNQVYADGRWFPLDTTWDSGIEPFWFDLPANRFHQAHTIGDLPGRDYPTTNFYR